MDITPFRSLLSQTNLQTLTSRSIAIRRNVGSGLLVFRVDGGKNINMAVRNLGGVQVV